MAQKLTRTGRPRELECPKCKLSVGIAANTVFHKSKVPLLDWFQLFFVLAHRTNGASVSFLTRYLGVSRLAAFRMMSATRLHIAALETPREFGGVGEIVQIDETLLSKVRAKGKKGTERAIVFGIFDQNGLYAQTVENRSQEILIPLILKMVRTGSTIVTDLHRSYSCLGGLGFRHVALNHSKGEWSTPSGLSMAGIESFWGNLKYFLECENRHPKVTTLGGYIAEVVWRQNARRQGYCPFEHLISRFPRVDLSQLTSGAAPHSRSLGVGHLDRG